MFSYSSLCCQAFSVTGGVTAAYSVKKSLEDTNCLIGGVHWVGGWVDGLLTHVEESSRNRSPYRRMRSASDAKQPSGHPL